MAAQFIPVGGHTELELAEAAMMSSVADDTPEGKSIVQLAEQMGVKRLGKVADTAELIPFTAETRMSGIDAERSEDHEGRRGRHRATRVDRSRRTETTCRYVAGEGGTPLAVAVNQEVYGLVYLKDTVKPGLKRTLRRLPGDGNPHGDGDRGQPADGGNDRQRSWD